MSNLSLHLRCLISKVVAFKRRHVKKIWAFKISGETEIAEHSAKECFLCLKMLQRHLLKLFKVKLLIIHSSAAVIFKFEPSATWPVCCFHRKLSSYWRHLAANVELKYLRSILNWHITIRIYNRLNTVNSEKVDSYIMTYWHLILNSYAGLREWITASTPKSNVKSQIAFSIQLIVGT